MRFLLILSLSMVMGRADSPIQTEEIILPSNHTPQGSQPEVKQAPAPKQASPDLLDNLTKPQQVDTIIWRDGGLHPHEKLAILLTGNSEVTQTVEIGQNGEVDLLFLTARKQNFLNLTTGDVTNKIKQLLVAEGWDGYTVNVTKVANP